MGSIVNRVSKKISRGLGGMYRSAVSRMPNVGFVQKKLNKKISYSQNGEDIIISNIFESRGIIKPNYIDIGAHHPYYLSNTALFYKKGSRGINIEPDPTLFSAFRLFRKGDINLNIGIAGKSGLLKFFIMDPPTLNTFSPAESKKYNKLGHKTVSEIKISVKTIDQILRKYMKNKKIDLMCVDVEGMDYDILKTIDFSKYKPSVLLIETVGYTLNDTGRKDKRIFRYMERNGYTVYADTKINTVFISNELM